MPRDPGVGFDLGMRTSGGSRSSILTTRLSVATNIRDCFMWAKNGVGLAMGDEMKAFLAPLPQYEFAMCAHTEYHLDATRIEDEKVVKIEVDESA